MRTPSRWVMRRQQHVALEPFDYDATALRPREVAVEVEFTAISPGTECANYLALDPDVLKPNRWCSYPWVPGYSGVGRVIGVGSAVSEVAVGDRIAGRIRHCSHITLNVDSPVTRLSDDLNPQHLAWLHIAGIGATPVHVAQHEPFAVIGVWGQGIIGNLTGQILAASGARVIGIDPVADRRALAQRCGIAETLDPSDAGFAEQIKQLTHGEGLDAAIDTTGHAPTTLAIPEHIRRRGSMVLLTHWRSQPVLDASAFIYNLFVKGITLIGAHEAVPGLGPMVHTLAWQQRKYARLIHQIKTGGIAIEPLISHRITPGQCQQAYDGLCFDRGHWCGVVVDWRQ